VEIDSSNRKRALAGRSSDMHNTIILRSRSKGIMSGVGFVDADSNNVLSTSTIGAGGMLAQMKSNVAMLGANEALFCCTSLV
jgi:hypothetical protein